MSSTPPPTRKSSRPPWARSRRRMTRSTASTTSFSPSAATVLTSSTASTSLAERVRRERISERMKYLQDLVPGCSKVTGKAVMLDKIINYVQSLQRQVEFLSMELAAVNPSIDLNIEGLLSKDMLHAQVGPPPVGFLPDLIHSQLLPSHMGLVQAGITNMVNQTDAFRRAINAQFTAMGGI